MNRRFIILNLTKHSWNKSNLLMVFLTAAVINGCGKEPEKKNYVARVNNSYLTQTDLDKMTDTSYKNNFYRSEIIRNWIDNELLYQQAIDEGIVKEEEFNRIIDESRKSLAAAMLLNKISDQFEFVYTDDDLQKFYDIHKDEFKLNRTAYLLNIAEFPDEGNAIEFRNAILQRDWQNVSETVKDITFSKREINYYISEEEIFPLEIRNIVEELNPGEISIAVSTDSSYTIVQPVEKYLPGTIPPLNLIKKEVEQRFKSFEMQKYIAGYIKHLYSDNEIEVKNQDSKK